MPNIACKWSAWPPKAHFEGFQVGFAQEVKLVLCPATKSTRYKTERRRVERFWGHSALDLRRSIIRALWIQIPKQSVA